MSSRSEELFSEAEVWVAAVRGSSLEEDVVVALHGRSMVKVWIEVRLDFFCDMCNFCGES